MDSHDIHHVTASDRTSLLVHSMRFGIMGYDDGRHLERKSLIEAATFANWDVDHGTVQLPLYPDKEIIYRNNYRQLYLQSYKFTREDEKLMEKVRSSFGKLKARAWRLACNYAGPSVVMIRKIRRKVQSTTISLTSSTCPLPLHLPKCRQVSGC